MLRNGKTVLSKSIILILALSKLFRSSSCHTVLYICHVCHVQIAIEQSSETQLSHSVTLEVVISKLTDDPGTARKLNASHVVADLILELLNLFVPLDPLNFLLVHKSSNTLSME